MSKIFNLHPPDEKLLAECEITTFRSSGSGGQHVQKTDSAVRLKHLPTGIVVKSQAERSQYLNKQICLEKLKEKLRSHFHRPKKRIPTKKTKGAKERTLHKKAKHSQKKKLRTRPIFE